MWPKPKAGSAVGLCNRASCASRGCRKGGRQRVKQRNGGEGGWSALRNGRRERGEGKGTGEAATRNTPEDCGQQDGRDVDAETTAEERDKNKKPRARGQEPPCRHSAARTGKTGLLCRAPWRSQQKARGLEPKTATAQTGRGAKTNALVLPGRLRRSGRPTPSPPHEP